MEQYIPKSVLVAEIEKKIKQYEDAFNKRAEKYLHEHLVEYWSQRVTDGSKFIDGFIDYMKGD